MNTWREFWNPRTTWGHAAAALFVVSAMVGGSVYVYQAGPLARFEKVAYLVLMISGLLLLVSLGWSLLAKPRTTEDGERP